MVLFTLLRLVALLLRLLLAVVVTLVGWLVRFVYALRLRTLRLRSVAVAVALRSTFVVAVARLVTLHVTFDVWLPCTLAVYVYVWLVRLRFTGCICSFQVVWLFWFYAFVRAFGCVLVGCLFTRFALVGYFAFCSYARFALLLRWLVICSLFAVYGCSSRLVDVVTFILVAFARSTFGYVLVPVAVTYPS